MENSQAKESSKEQEPLTIFADGTGYKGGGCGGKARAGDIKMVLGVNTQGEVFSLGTHADISWKDIAAKWKKSKLMFPDGSILVCDGERAITNELAEFVEETQRCHWHLNRDLYHFVHADGGNTEIARPYQKRLAGIISINLPQEDLSKVSDDEKQSIERRMQEADKKLLELIKDLREKKYDAAANYLYRARTSVFGYLRRWLRWGIISPKASSLIERMMRTIGRRIKCIAYGWSTKGVEKIARIIVKRNTDSNEWENFWKEKMKLSGNVFAKVMNYTSSSPNLAH